MEVKSDVVVSSDIGWLEMLSFTWFISSCFIKILLCSLGKMSEDRVGCCVSSNENQLEAFFMRTLLTRRKSCVSCQSLNIKAKGVSILELSMQRIHVCWI